MMMNMNTCLRCEYEWESRIESKPKNCPNCKSPAWDRPKVANNVATRANGLVGAAVRRGELIRQPCEVCGDKKSDAHHEDYSKPLDVRWLCRKHHRQRHKEIGDPLMTAGMVLRGIPDKLARQVKATAASEGQTLVEFVTTVLERDVKRGGWTASKKETNGSQASVSEVKAAGPEIGSVGIKGGKAGRKAKDTRPSEAEQGGDEEEIGLVATPELSAALAAGKHKRHHACPECGGLNGMHQKGCKR
jgi:transposase-like protein